MTQDEITTILSKVFAAAVAGKITRSASDNIRIWLTEERYAPYADQVSEMVKENLWKELDDVFWTVIPFGTGGRRGKMFPVGSNAINDATIGESAQGVASYVLECLGPNPTHQPTCAVAYDTRHQSRHFAELCSSIMCANGFKVWFLDGFRSTPEISFMVRYKQCDCGIMVTASHNPPSDNAVKVYWNTGGQLLSPHDVNVIHRVMNVKQIKTMRFRDALESRKVEYCEEDVDAAYVKSVLKCSSSGPRNLNIVYSPLHGVGCTCVLPVLHAAGFNQIQLYGPHSEPSGDFPNVPNHVSNPENPDVFTRIIEDVQGTDAELILATDPDSDRLGCAAPLEYKSGSPWQILTGNQIGSLMTEYLLDVAKQSGNLCADSYIVKTLVTTELMRRIADAYGVRTVGDLLVGFKYIGGVMEEYGTEHFIFGAEESYGFLTGGHARDKDAAVAGMVLSELAAKAKEEGKTLHEKLHDLFEKYGFHAERAFSLGMPGSDGMSKMRDLMQKFRTSPPEKLAGLKVTLVKDYANQETLDTITGERTALKGPQGDLVMLYLEETGNYVAVRPSGTEPKVKFYMFTYSAPDGELLHEKQRRMERRLEQMQLDLRDIA